MGLSAYAIGKKVWLVHTEITADDRLPDTLPLGSIVLSRHDASALAQQMEWAAQKAAKQPAVGRIKDASASVDR